MKIICDCGNEAVFNTINEDTKEENPIYEDEGQYATIDKSKFNFTSNHYEIYFTCEKCEKILRIFK